MPKTKDELFEELKAEHDIDVQALIDGSSANSGVAELSAKLTEVLGGANIIKLSNGETANAEDLVLAVGQLVEDKTELSNRIGALEAASAKASAEAEVDKLIGEGRIAEATRDAFVDLKLSAPETFDKIVPEQPIIKLSGEPTGFAPADETPDATVQSEIDRYSAIDTQ